MPAMDPPARAALLLIEDDPDTREAVSELMTVSGYPTAAAANGREAIEWLRTTAHKPRLILLDMMMPVMDGWGFRAAQQEDPQLASIPVVVITALEEVWKVVEVIRPAAVLRKPLNPDSLLELVHLYCRRPA